MTNDEWRRLWAPARWKGQGPMKEAEGPEGNA